jgi:hypothetical protein
MGKFLLALTLAVIAKIVNLCYLKHVTLQIIWRKTLRAIWLTGRAARRDRAAELGVA